MNSMEWLESVVENAQKSPKPPVPPEGGLQKNTGNTLIPPVPPCSPEHFIENDEISPTGLATQPEIYFGEEQNPETSGGHRGNQGFYRGIEDSGDTGLR